MIPNPRKSNLVIQESGDDLLVYDLDSNRAICLNRTSRLVWEKCDGLRSPWEIQTELRAELKTKVSEDFVWFALDQLQREDLLINEESFAAVTEGLSRRDVIRKLGLVSVASLPIVTSLVAPMAVNAQSTSVCVFVKNGCTCSTTGMSGGRGNECEPAIPCEVSTCTCVHANMGNNFKGNCEP